MFGFLKKLFSSKEKEKTIKHYSTTLTSATEGEHTQDKLIPKLNKLIDDIRNSRIGKLSLEEVNLIQSYLFNKEPINPGFYKFNKVIDDSVVFEIVNLGIIFDENNDVKDFVIVLKDLTHNFNMTVNISSKEFYEVFEDVELNLNSVTTKEKE